MTTSSRAQFLQTSAVMKSAGVGRETLRFYEKKGLLPKAQRTDSGYRQYTKDTVELIRFIKEAQGAGFTLKEIQELTRLRTKAMDTCGNVSQVLTKKLGAIENEIAELQKKSKVLSRLSRECSGEDENSSCSILPGRGRVSLSR